MKRITNNDEVAEAARQIAAALSARGEWFCAERGAGALLALKRDEFEVRAEHGRLLFSYWSERGARVWRVVAWEQAGEKIRMTTTRRMGAERATLELTPRAAAAAHAAAITQARRAACERLAALACAQLAGARIERARLSAGARRGQPGRYARIILRHGRATLAVTGDVAASERLDPDAFLAATLLWFARLNERKNSTLPAPKLWLVVPPRLSSALSERLALLRGELRRAIELREIDEEWRTLAPLPPLALDALLARAPRFHRPAPYIPGEWAARIIALAPDAIDMVRARHGETLRFHGLAFARVRRVADREHVWFGVAGAQRRLLDEENWPDFCELLRELAEHRCAAARDARHALYAAAPEAWLESLLRRDITRLDPGLRLSPLHAQFRARGSDARQPARPVDLLALRRDGRLVVIELKVAEDAALPLQGADYWRQIETHRRHGHIARAHLFAEAELSVAPPLVYLAAPILRFHRAFRPLARAIAPEIEMYRFDLNEDWRAGVRVLRRTQVG